MGRLAAGHHKEQRDHAEDQAERDATVQARRPHLAVLHVQVAHLLQLCPLEVDVRVDVVAAQAGC